MRTSTFCLGVWLIVGFAGPSLAQGSSGTPDNSASSSQEAAKMKSGDKAGSLPNSSNPGSDAGADGNKTQDSRTTKTRDR